MPMISPVCIYCTYVYVQNVNVCCVLGSEGVVGCGVPYDLSRIMAELNVLCHIIIHADLC